jgi:hypothetical protein
MTKCFSLAVAVLLGLTGAAQAQQPPSPTNQQGNQNDQAFPPAYAPPPGYAPPSTPPAYGAPPPAYVPPPAYGPPGYGPYRYPPPRFSYYPPPPPPPRQVTDRPFTIGGGIGFGGLRFTDAVGRRTTDGGTAYTLRLGFGLRPGLILMWDLEGAVIDRNHTLISQTANLGALQLFLTSRLFAKAGFGLAQVVQEQYSSAWGGAAMAGIGYELIQGWNWSLDMEATVTGARYRQNGSDETWTNWSLVNFAINFF